MAVNKENNSQRPKPAPVPEVPTPAWLLMSSTALTVVLACVVLVEAVDVRNVQQPVWGSSHVIRQAAYANALAIALLATIGLARRHSQLIALGVFGSVLWLVVAMAWTVRQSSLYLVDGRSFWCPVAAEAPVSALFCSVMDVASWLFGVASAFAAISFLIRFYIEWTKALEFEVGEIEYLNDRALQVRLIDSAN